MDVFFMSVWDQTRLGTKFYICYGEETTNGYHTETLPILWLADAVATDFDAAEIITQLWFSENRYHLSFDPGEGKHLFAPTLRVFELMGQLKRKVADYNRSRTTGQPPQSLGTVRRTGEDSWVMYGAGGGGGSGGAVVAGVDVGNGQMAFDIETLGVPYGGGGGGAARSGSELHQHIARNGYARGGGIPNGGGSVPSSVDGSRASGRPIDGEWGSMPRSQSARQRVRQQRHIVERNVELPLRSELPVQIRFHDGRREDCTIEHYNEMIDTGVWTGMERINT